MAAAAGRQLFLARRAAWLLSALPCCAPAPGPASVGPSASAPPGRFNLSIGLVFPTHPPHFAWACNLVASARGQTRAKLYAAFGSEKEAAAFHGAYATPLALAPSLGALLRLSDEWQLSALVVPIGGAGTSKAVPTFKKWRALRELFARTPAEHLLAIDDESLVRPRSPADPDLPWYLAQHHAQRHVLVGPPFWAHWGSATRAYGTGTEGWSGAGGAEAGASAPLARAEGRFATSKYKITAVSCAIVGAPPLPGFAWWADLPVYDRADFGDFYRRLDMGLARTWYAFDHLTYLCYKAFYRGWEVRAVARPVENMGCKGQQRFAPWHTFGWANGAGCDNATHGPRYLDYALDKRTEPASSCAQHAPPAAPAQQKQRKRLLAVDARSHDDYYDASHRQS